MSTAVILTECHALRRFYCL